MADKQLSAKNEWRREYDRQRYRARLDRCIEYLGGKCVRCSATENLQFDHIDPSTKSFTIVTRWKLPFEQLKAELDLCQLLCEPCHLAKTRIERPPWRHGTLSGYARGCREACCREAQRQYTREYRQRVGRKRTKVNSGAHTVMAQKWPKGEESR